MNHDNIVMTAADHAELSSVVTLAGKVSSRMKFEMRLLENELKRAEIVQAEDLPPDVITMNSRAELFDLASACNSRLSSRATRTSMTEKSRFSLRWGRPCSGTVSETSLNGPSRTASGG